LDLLHYKVISKEFILQFPNHFIVSTSVNSQIVQSAFTWFWNLKQVEGSFTLKLLPNACHDLKWGVLGGQTGPLKPACLILHHSDDQDTEKYSSVLLLKPSPLIFTFFGLGTKILVLFKAMAKLRNVKPLTTSTVSKGKKSKGRKSWGISCDDQE